MVKSLIMHTLVKLPVWLTLIQAPFLSLLSVSPVFSLPPSLAVHTQHYLEPPTEAKAHKHTSITSTNLDWESDPHYKQHKHVKMVPSTIFLLSKFQVCKLCETLWTLWKFCATSAARLLWTLRRYPRSLLWLFDHKVGLSEWPSIKTMEKMHPFRF